MNISVGLTALLESQYLSGVQNMHFSPPILLLLIHLCALNYCLAMLCYVLMKHDAPSTVLQTRVLRQYLFSPSKIVLSIFLRVFFSPLTIFWSLQRTSNCSLQTGVVLQYFSFFLCFPFP